MDELNRQPRQLSVLFLTEMWERYGYYTMRGILVLYMTKVFLFSNTRAYTTFAAFTALVYLTPLFGGWIADRFLGFRRSVVLGGVLLAAGYGLLSLPGQGLIFQLALGTLIVGNGFFKPNVSSLVGQLYGKNDPRREGGFTIFYAGINVGSLIPPLITGWVIIQFGWHIAFVMAGIGVLIGTLVFYFGLRKHPHLGAPPDTGQTPALRLGNYFLISVGTLAAIYLFAELVKNTGVTNILLFVGGGIFLAYSFSRSFSFKDIRRDYPDVGLVVVGRNATIPFVDIEAKMKPLMEEGRGFYLLRAPEEDVVDFYRGAWYYISTSITDGESLMLKEAMKCGTPVITSPLLEETVGGNAVILEDPTDQKQTADVFRRIIPDDDLRKHYSDEGQKWMQSLSWDKVARESLEFIETR